MQEFFLLLRSLEKPAEEEPGPAAESLGTGPGKPEAEEREWKAARRKARAQLKEMTESYRRVCVQLAEQLDDMQSPENLAAMMAPQDEKALLMQRMEDSSLRQLWRLTNVLFRVRNGALTPRDVKNEGTSGDVYENKGASDTMPDY
jgi:flagellar hook-length control protein FliK